MRRERKILTILLALLLLPAIYLTISPEINTSERYLKLSLQNPVKKFTEVKKAIREKKSGKAGAPESNQKTQFSPEKEFKRLHRKIGHDFSAYSQAAQKKWSTLFSF